MQLEPKLTRCIFHAYSRQSIKLISLWKCNLGDDDLHELSAGLIRNTSLTSLDLSYNNITSSGSQTLSQFITTTPAPLATLVLDHNPIATLEFLNSSVCRSMHITEFSAKYCGIDDRGVVKFGEALGESERLKTLDLTGNALSVDGLVSISKCLRVNKSLSRLLLSNNKISIDENRASVVLGDVDANVVLRELDLSGSAVPDDVCDMYCMISCIDCQFFKNVLELVQKHPNMCTVRLPVCVDDVSLASHYRRWVLMHRLYNK